MRGILNLVVTHPRVHRKLLSALEDAFDGDTAEMRYEHVKDIPYLDATIDEGCVYPTVLLLLISQFECFRKAENVRYDCYWSA